jgi:hypothetical protein
MLRVARRFRPGGGDKSPLSIDGDRRGVLCLHGITGTPFEVRPLAEALGRRARWPHFIAAWNFANVVQYLVLLALTLLPEALGLPRSIGQGLGLVALGYALWLEWFVARTALQVQAGLATGLVVLDFLIGLFVGGLVMRLS